MIEVFPVQLVRGQTYDPGTDGRGRTCRANPDPWWTSNTFVQRRGDHQHNAVDLMAPLGARVVAPVSGRVVEQWTYNGERRSGVSFSDAGGWTVRMEDADGNSHFFSHMLREPEVRPGQRLRAGDLIGYVGQTGNARSTCPHLHYQVRDPRWRAINPIPELAPMLAAKAWSVSPSFPWLWIAGGTAALIALGWFVIPRFRGD
jgi:murein DD-endopeptidase MepM/ murein hydrolase activator NlpD